MDCGQNMRRFDELDLLNTSASDIDDYVAVVITIVITLMVGITVIICNVFYH